MSLPAHWVDSIFARMTVRYGAAWIRMWDGVDISSVKTDWANELDHLADHPESIAYGLDHLPPDRPPTVGQFKALCCRPAEPFKALPVPKADPAKVKAVQEKMRVIANNLRMRMH